MPGHVKLFVPVMAVLISIYSITNVYANSLDDAIEAYNYSEYKKSIILLKKHISKNPSDSEAYKWLAKSYEANFEIGKALKAYRRYETIKKDNIVLKPKTSISPIPFITPSPKEKIPEIKQTVVPTPIPTNTPLPKESNYKKMTDIDSKLEVTPKITPSPIPTIAKEKDEVKVATLKKTNNKAAVKIKKENIKELILQNKGWKYIKVLNVDKKKVLKMIPENSVDMIEADVPAKDGYYYIIVNSIIKYSDDIEINRDSSQISLIDDKGQKHNLLAMSTFNFIYQGDNVSKKVKTFAKSPLYFISTKDPRQKLTFIFEIPAEKEPKTLDVLGFTKINL